MLKNNGKKKIKKVITGLGKAIKAHTKQKKMLQRKYKRKLFTKGIQKKNC